VWLARCPREIDPDDLVRYAQDWDAELRAVLPSIEKVDRPLWPLVKEKAQLADFLAERGPMSSCLEGYYERRPPRATRRRAGG
jgi:hypothetical protein